MEILIFQNGFIKFVLKIIRKKVGRQAGAELYQAQFKLGLAMHGLSS
jgi:hypothetical protein